MSSRLPLRSRHAVRGLRAVAALVAASSLLFACGGGSGGGSGGSSVVVLDDNQVKAALLTLDNMPDGWKVSTDTDNDLADAPGCLADLDKLDQPDAESDGSADFEDAALGLPALSTQVASFGSERDVTEAMDTFREAFTDCDHVDYTDPSDDTTIVLDFESDDEKSSPEVDDQFNLTATGTISSGFDFPFGLWLSIARVDNNTTAVMITDLSEDAGSALDPYTQMAVDRLVAVLNGDSPEPTQGPAIGAEAGGVLGDPSESTSEDGFEQLPMDGGSYTWASGVTMKLTVDRVEPWGRKDDFCGDGSCGIANPDDTRVVLKYEVTVPSDASEPFDAFSCPGLMYPTSGNDDDALGSAYGDFAKPIEGKIFPGSTKTGFDEYYVEKAYADQEFYIESSCGDVDFTGETAYFVGQFN